MTFSGKSRRSFYSSYSPWFLLALILLLAGGLRLYRIDAQSFWNDEGNSARLAERSVQLILEGAKGDIHPPGYYLVLHYWRTLLGHSEAALRGLSAASGVALVAVTFLLGRRLFEDDTIGLVAAALVAINPFEVYFAQEARMYAMLALWAMGSTWALVVWWQAEEQPPGGRRWPLAAFALMTAAGLYTHYAFPFVMLAQGLGTGLWAWSTRGRPGVLDRLWQLVLACGAAVVLYWPWLPTAWRQVTSWTPPGETYQISGVLADVWRLLNFGQTISTPAATGGLIAAGAGALLSLLPTAASQVAEHRANGLPLSLRWGFLVALVLLPTGLILGLDLYRVAYQKFLLVAAAPLALLVARGIVNGWRVAGRAGLWRGRIAGVGFQAFLVFIAVLFLYATGRSLNNLYFDPAFARADYQSIAGYIQANARPGDAIILNAPNQWEVFTYYHPDENVFPLARQRPLDVAMNLAELERITADHRRLFAIYWGDVESDPERVIEGWLEANTYKAGETWYSDVRLAVYAVPTGVADVPATSLNARFERPDQAEGPSIYLDGYTLLNEALAPGDIMQLALFWRTEEPIAERYKVFVHLYDAAGELVAQTDSEPGGALRPTTTWASGERIVDRYGVVVPAALPAGAYSVTVGLYELADPSNRLHVSQDGAPASDHLDLTHIVLARGG